MPLLFGLACPESVFAFESCVRSALDLDRACVAEPGSACLPASPGLGPFGARCEEEIGTPDAIGAVAPFSGLCESIFGLLNQRHGGLPFVRRDIDPEMVEEAISR